MAAITATKPHTAVFLFSRKNLTPAIYQLVTLSKKLLNHLKRPEGSRCACSGLIISAHKAGVSVKATSAEISTETAIVTENCLYITPVIPPKNAIGRKTEDKTSATATTGPETSFIALIAASLGDSFSSVIRRSTFSNTIIASSTTIPIAKIKPNNVNRLMENPKTYIPANAPIIETGTAKIGISVARIFCRNR